MPVAEGEITAYRDTLGRALRAATGPDARAIWSALGAAGAIRRLYSAASDGANDPAPAPVLVGALLAELDACLPTGVVLSVCVQVATVIPILLEAARAGALASRVGGAALDGEAIVALAVTDAGVPGSDLLEMRTRARIGEGRVVLDGGKEWITNATHCDHALVLARHREARHFTSFCWVLTPAGAPGVSSRPAASSLFAGSGVGHLRLDAVTLDSEHVIGRPGRALADFARRIGTERLAGALWARSLCRRVLADTRRWLAARPAGGGTLWDNPAVRERFACCLVELGRLEALCAAHQVCPVGRSQAAGMVLKAAVGEGVERVLAECASLRGADAFRDGGEAHLRAQAAMFGTAGGATGAMLAGIADHADELLRAAP